ncbi:hypothetical protein G6F35_013891 [Rhizopus arrhizus]|nr:hypothetical protein G6F35_013891 [Rhizopus arrhizus]
MALQLLVENAIKHGIASRPGGGEVQIRATLDNDVLRLQVDNPLGSAIEPTHGHGVGLAYLRAQLGAAHAVVGVAVGAVRGRGRRRAGCARGDCNAGTRPGAVGCADALRQWLRRAGGAGIRAGGGVRHGLRRLCGTRLPGQRAGLSGQAGGGAAAAGSAAAGAPARGGDD